MLRTVEILGLRAIRYARIELGEFQVLVGPNASGKSTFLDALLLVRDILTAGLARAFHGDARFDISPRVSDPRDVTWMRSGGALEIALTFDLPQAIRDRLPEAYTTARYECGLETGELLSFSAETLWLCRDGNGRRTGALAPQRALFPDAPTPPEHIIKLPNQHAPTGWRKVISKNPQSGNDTFTAETGRWNNPFRLGAERSALANLPADEERFPASLWVRQLLMEGVHRIQLNAERMREPSPAGSPTTFLPDGSNLPWVVHDLEQRAPATQASWLAHVRTALPDVKAITTRERDHDRARYLEVEYDNGLHAPSWVLSDGTLRMLALTLLAYAEPTARMLLIEEPENGIHPRAVETVVQSLQSVYGGQVLLATHSTLVLSQVRDEQLLCFAKGTDGAIDIVRGSEHPRLATWRSALNLGDLLAAGVLG
jgi:predicted ATPase